ncbi:MAG: hypothetical protein ABIS30_12385 [Gallionella sp.]|jgi:hypothetical protein
MNTTTDPQELVRRFNADEAVWQSYEQKRGSRRLLGKVSPLSEEVLDYLDWLEAGRERQETHCIGRLMP